MSVNPQESGWLRRNRHYVVLLAAGVGSLAAYKAYRAGQDRVQALQATLAKYSDAAASAGDIVAVLSDDLRQFLASESDEVPRSLRQLAKLARSRDVQDTLAACVSSTLRGVLATPAAAAADGSPTQPSVVDKVLEALLSDRGHSLVALAIQTAAHTSTDTFCTAVREGLQAALGSQQHAGSGGDMQLAGAAAAAPGGATSSSSVHSWSPQLHHHRHHHHHQQQQPDVMPPSLAALLAALSSPQVLQLVDGLVSTCVGSAVGAYVSRAGSVDLFTAALNALGQPGNKELVVDMMSSVSAAFCREMAAACVAPASAVASRPASRLGGPELCEQLQRQQQQVGLLGSPVKQLLPHSASAAGLSAAGRDGEDDDGSEPSTPQSGPGTPEPSVAAAAAAAAAAAGAGRDSFGGSAVAGLVLRRNSFPGLGGSSGGGGSGGGDLASLGPMSSLVSLFVQAARFQEFRSLVVDVSRSSTREFVVSLLPAGGLFGGWQAGLRAGGGGSDGVPPVFVACMYRVYTMVTVLLFLVVHALGPKTLLGDGM